MKLWNAFRKEQNIYRHQKKNNVKNIRENQNSRHEENKLYLFLTFPKLAKWIQMMKVKMKIFIFRVTIYG